jgi:hypothetical protein
VSAREALEEPADHQKPLNPKLSPSTRHLCLSGAGAKGYNQLKEQSVKIAKKAKKKIQNVPVHLSLVRHYTLQ